MVDLLADFASRGGVMHEKEPRGFQKYKCHMCKQVVVQADVKAHKRQCKVDLIRSGPDLRAFIEHSEVFYDYSTLHVTAPSHLADILRGMSHKAVAAKVVDTKVETYRLNFPEESFKVILAFELGGLDKPLVHLITQLAREAHQDPELFLDEFAVTLATYNGDAVVSGLRQG